MPWHHLQIIKNCVSENQNLKYHLLQPSYKNVKSIYFYYLDWVLQTSSVQTFRAIIYIII